MVTLGRLVAVSPPPRREPVPRQPARFDVTLVNAGQTRRYLVRGGRTPGTWRCELVLNGQHGAALNETDEAGVQSFTTHAERSITYLEEEGWIRMPALAAPPGGANSPK
jgi:hypothetical protein